MDVIRRPLAAAGRWLGSVRPQRRYLRADLVAGLPGAISSVPDGMAAAVLVGVNPVQGLYAGFAGPIAGGLTSSTRLMVITTTSAASLAAGSALRSVPEAQRPEALLLLALMAGAALVAAGLAGLGRYTRFVSYSVMIGFLTGISVNIACGQVADLTGAEAHGAFPLAKAVDVIIHPTGIDLASLLTGLSALAILVVLARTRIAMVSALIALVVPTVVVILAGADSVARVGDAGDIPRGIITDYAGRLADADGRLYLSGLRPDLTERLRRTGSIQGPLRAVEATPVVGESTHTAYLDAEAWLVNKHDPPDAHEAASDGSPGTTSSGRGPGEPPSVS